MSSQQQPPLPPANLNSASEPVPKSMLGSAKTAGIQSMSDSSNANSAQITFPWKISKLENTQASGAPAAPGAPIAISQAEGASLVDCTGGQAQIYLIELEEILKNALPSHAVCKRFILKTKTTKEDRMRYQNECMIYKYLLNYAEDRQTLPKCAKSGKFTFDLYSTGELSLVNAAAKFIDKDPFLIMEAGSLCLAKLILNYSKPNSLSQRMILFRMAVCAMARFDPENTNFYHRDLKADNFVFGCLESKNHTKQPNFNDLRVIDFGLSCWGNFHSDFAGENYNIPKDNSDRAYADKYDLFSMGTVLLTVILWKFGPNGWGDSMQILIDHYQGKKITIGNHIDQTTLQDENFPKIDDLLTRLLCKNPAQRMSWKELFDHEFIRPGSIYDTEFLGTLEVSTKPRSEQCSIDAISEYSQTGGTPRAIIDNLAYFGIFQYWRQNIQVPQQVLKKNEEVKLKFSHRPNVDQQHAHTRSADYSNSWELVKNQLSNYELFELAKISSASTVCQQFVSIWMLRSAQHLFDIAIHDLDQGGMEERVPQIVQITLGLSVVGQAVAQKVWPDPTKKVLQPSELGSWQRCTLLLITMGAKPEQELYTLTSECLLILNQIFSHHGIYSFPHESVLELKRVFITLFLITYWDEEIKGLSDY